MRGYRALVVRLCWIPNKNCSCLRFCSSSSRSSCCIFCRCLRSLNLLNSIVSNKPTPTISSPPPNNRIRRKLKDSYEVSVILPWDEEAINPRSENKQEVSLSVRVGVSHYLYSKLEDLLGRYAATTNAIGNVRALISRDIDRALDK